MKGCLIVTVSPCDCSALSAKPLCRAAQNVFVFLSVGADIKANACGAACALQRRERCCGRQQLAQHDRSRHADALALQVELCDAVLAQRHERDPAEVGDNRVLEHHVGQMVRGIARDAVEADTVSPRHTQSNGMRGTTGHGHEKSESWAATECSLC